MSESRIPGINRHHRHPHAPFLAAFAGISDRVRGLYRPSLFFSGWLVELPFIPRCAVKTDIIGIRMLHPWLLPRVSRTVSACSIGPLYFSVGVSWLPVYCFALAFAAASDCRVKSSGRVSHLNLACRSDSARISQQK